MIIDGREYTEPELRAYISELKHKIYESDDQIEYLTGYITNTKSLLSSIRCHLLYLVDADIENTMSRNRTMELIEKINEIIGG